MMVDGVVVFGGWCVEVGAREERASTSVAEARDKDGERGAEGNSEERTEIAVLYMWRCLG